MLFLKFCEPVSIAARFAGCSEGDIPAGMTDEVYLRDSGKLASPHVQKQLHLLHRIIKSSLFWGRSRFAPCPL